MIKIATDVTADLPESHLKQYQIHLIPAWVQTPTDRVRTDALSREALVRLIAEARDANVGSVRTVPLAADEYCELFDALLGADDVLVFVSTSSHLTPVHDLVCQAAQRMTDRVTVVDSGGLSLWQGLLAVGAARLVAAGGELDALLASLGRMQAQTQFFFILDSLAYLHKGGRVNLAQYMLGSVLDIKPILMIRDGRVVPAGSTRGHERALVKMQLALLESLREVPSVFMGIVHVEAEGLAHRVAELMIDTLRPAHTFITDAGPTVSLHGGPGAVGIAVCPIN